MKRKLDEGHYHEICHTAYIIMSMIDTHLMAEYPEDKKMVKMAQDGLEAIGKIYQYAGSKF